jgi:hypothetical protein
MVITGKARSMTSPEPFMKGRFNVYKTPDGGLHISYTVDGGDEVEHMSLPGPMVRAAQMMSEGKMNPLEFFRLMRGR